MSAQGERDPRYRAPYKLWKGYHPAGYGRGNRDFFSPQVEKWHLGKRITDKSNWLWGSYTALCDLKEKGWHGSHEGPIRVRDMKGKRICRRCIQLAGLEARVPEEATVGVIKVDMTGSSRNDFNRPIPTGEYEAVIEKVEQKPTRKGQPMLVFTWKITTDEMTGETVNDEGDLEVDTMKTAGRWLWVNYVLPSATWKLRQDLVKLGQDVPDEGELELDTDELVGLSAILTVACQPHWSGEVDKNTGKPRMDNEILELSAA